MTEFNQELADKDFYRGKRHLDSGRFMEAIEIYNQIIKDHLQFAGSKGVNILLETSLNNRGVAKCQLGLYKREKELYKDGMQDLEESIKIDTPPGKEKEWLTAYRNLKYAEKEIESFDKQDQTNTDNFWSSI